mmetsp:Transcript_9074/g.13596  ORF Transcript_9074/g.13596 Transcript_9074/m.13596 type:complete len:144 (+) Transcript_9074:342-773(+)
MPTAAKKKGAAFQKLSEDATQKKDPTNSPKKGMNSIASRIVLLFMFPLCVGSMGLGASHFQNTFTSDPNPPPMNFERDFILPFLMTMVLVVVVKKQRIIRRTVVADDDGNVIEDEDLLKSLRDNNADDGTSSKQKDGKAKKDD